MYCDAAWIGYRRPSLIMTEQNSKLRTISCEITNHGACVKGSSIFHFDAMLEYRFAFLLSYLPSYSILLHLSLAAVVQRASCMWSQFMMKGPCCGWHILSSYLNVVSTWAWGERLDLCQLLLIFEVRYFCCVLCSDLSYLAYSFHLNHFYRYVTQTLHFILPYPCWIVDTWTSVWHSALQITMKICKFRWK